jgi:hypothetical protein
MQIKLITLDIRLSENTRRAIRWVLLPGAVFLGSVAVARATIDTSWIGAGKTISSASLTTDLTQLDTRLTAVEMKVGTSSSAASGIVWKDSTGTVVPIVRADGDPTNGIGALNFEFIDSATGNVWVYEPLQADPVGPANSPLLGYPTTNCTGTPFIASWNTPRYALSVPTKTGYYVIPDTALPIQTAVLSFQNGSGTCQMGGLSINGFPFSTLVPATKPAAPPGKPPYHPEIQ